MGNQALKQVFRDMESEVASSINPDSDALFSSESKEIGSDDLYSLSQVAVRCDMPSRLPKSLHSPELMVAHSVTVSQSTDGKLLLRTYEHTVSCRLQYVVIYVYIGHHIKCGQGVHGHRHIQDCELWLE